jgi:uncharacterized protein YegL
MAVTDVERGVFPRKTMVLFFLIDTSGSMAGTRIGAVNSAMEQTLEKLAELNLSNPDAEIVIAVLEFSSGARWIMSNSGPVKVENYYWNDLNADGLTHMGEAFRLLEEALHKSSGFMQRASGSYAPVLFIMTDGEPNDNYATHLEKLKNNSWFKLSTKVALAVGDEANDQVLIEFTGTKEAVVRVPDGHNAGEKLSKMIQFLAVKSSQINSNPSETNGKTKQDIMNDAIQSIANSDNDEFSVDDSSDNDDEDWNT